MVETEYLTSKSTPTTSGTKLCRLCLEHDENTFNLFEGELEENVLANKVSVAQQLTDLFQIKYDKSPSLPNSICKRCIYMVESFNRFRENLKYCESELQKWLMCKLKCKSEQLEETSPGLNGNPGIFEPDVDCIVTEIDPDQEYESSGDDFSMESDTDTEEVSATEKSLISAAHPQYTSEKSNNTEIENLPSLSADVDHADISHSDVAVAYASATTGQVDSITIEPKNTYLCQYCDMAFTTQLDCSEHESRHDAAAPYACNFCSLRTTSRPSLIYHIKESHDPERPYVCAFCNKGFCRRSDLKKHTIVHTGVRPFTCPVCAKSFSRNTNLTKHMRIHSSIKPHVCQRCPRSFTTAAELVRHARSHMETKPFQCGRCSASFTRKDKLQLHEQAHYRRDSEFLMNQSKIGVIGSAGMDERQRMVTAVDGPMENIIVPLNPYGEHESMPSSLDDPYRHSILAAQLQQRPAIYKPTPPPKQPHSRLFTCDICARSFTRERDLQRHQALHLDSLFTCKQCGIGFNRREKLVRHEQELHAPQFPCKICRIKFSKPEELEMHLKMHELQHNVAMTTQAARNAASGNIMSIDSTPLPAASTSQEAQLPQLRPSAADMSFYSQMVPTMNLGFYSETRPEDRNGI